MAYWIHKAGTSTRPNYRFFYMDSDESVSELPTATTDGVKQSVDSSAHNVCSIGSKALSLSTSTIYKLDSNNKWVSQSSLSGSSAGGGQSAYQIAVEYGFEGSVEEWLVSLHGKDGENGADGKAATIKVGQVTTVDPDANASVVNTGTETNASFDFSIPKGQPGTNGSDGYSPTIVENVENTDGIYKLDVTTKTETFTTPNLMGSNGADGQDGITPNIQIGNVETLEPGEEATANITGSPESPTLNLGIPKGETGTSSQVDHGTADTTFQLPPNQLHTWGEVPSLTLTLGSGASGIVNEYMFSFTSGITATTLSLPAAIQTDIVVEPNTYYECSIVNNYMVFRDWPIEEESA